MIAFVRGIPRPLARCTHTCVNYMTIAGCWAGGGRLEHFYISPYPNTHTLSLYKQGALILLFIATTKLLIYEHQNHLPENVVISK